jgi:DNA-binding NtrC family response regulator
MNTNTRVLVVDDEEIVRRSHMRILASVPCKVEAVPNGKQALEAMAAESYDVVLLDLRMPGMDGLTVLKAIKQKWPDSEIVVITGYPCLDTAKEAIRLGAHDYLSKPVGPNEVINATTTALQHKQWALRPVQALNTTTGAQA